MAPRQFLVFLASAALIVAAPAQAEILEFALNDCRSLATAGADYVPGLDVNGRPVAPADLPGAGTPPIPIIIDISRSSSGGQRGAAATTGSQGGVPLTIVGGKAYFGDQPLDPADRDALIRACTEAR